jgi:hypothetical protein
MKVKQRACVEIQRVYRGRLGRIVAKRIRSEKLKNKYTILVQTEYRRRLAKFDLQAKKREAKNNIRYRAARRQRATYFKAIGLNKRKSVSVYETHRII